MKWRDGESLRQTAERALSAVLPGLNPVPANTNANVPSPVNYLGNAPCGVYSYNYSKKLKEKFGLKRKGAKIFFFKAHLLDWQTALKFDSGEETYRKPLWLTKQELLQKVATPYARSVGSFILDF